MPAILPLLYVNGCNVSWAPLLTKTALFLRTVTMAAISGLILRGEKYLCKWGLL